MLRGLTALVLTLLGMSAAWAQASVQAWPSKQPIRVVVPIAAGSGTDLTARLVFEQVSNQIGQAIVVENRVGAGGIIGTNAVAKVAAKLTDAGKLVTVAGGGDTVAALNQAGAAEHFTYISTAGGAFLEWLEGKTLPGVAVLMT